MPAICFRQTKRVLPAALFENQYQKLNHFIFEEDFIMAERPVFITRNKTPFYDRVLVDFTWNAGLSASQKKKNVEALHAAYTRRFPDRKVLEISSKSQLDLGIRLSAFNLKKFVPSLGRSVSIECIYHGGKVFSGGGPYTDLYDGTSRQAKKDERLKTSGALRAFYYEGEEFSLVPKNAFYDWLYINALMEDEELAKQLLEYDSFTDIEFNPNKSVNCQARAAARFVSLHRSSLLDSCRDYHSFVSLIS